jgi:uncharacterized membrane protein YdjX (TVP38/TMEM64 family)
MVAQRDITYSLEQIALLVLLVAAIAVLLGVFHSDLKTWLADLLDWVRGLGIWGPIVLAAVYVVGE